MNRNRSLMLVFLAAGAIAIVTIASLRFTETGNPRSSQAPSPAVAKAAVEPLPQLVTERLAIQRGDTLSDLLTRAGVELPARQEMIDAVTDTFDVRKFRAGTELTLTRATTGPPASLEYVIDPDHKLRLSQSGDAYSASVIDIPSTIRAEPVCGTLSGSLFESIERTGENAELAMRIAGIFAWDIDFYTDPREGDEFCLLVEKKLYDNGQPPTYGRILSARYNNVGKIFEAYLFEDKTGKPQYFAGDGHSLQAAFLRSPMKFEARVSSHFSHRRFHPVLKIYRPHLGTDYAAPAGTPVQAIASGRVISSGYGRGEGNMIRIQHSNGYETLYLHLSRRFVRTGDRVEQGDRIGLVGSTGLATGPHLDFRMRRNGSYVNFERLQLPRDSEVRKEKMAEFASLRDRFRDVMDSGYTWIAAAIIAREGSPAALCKVP